MQWGGGLIRGRYSSGGKKEWIHTYVYGGDAFPRL